MDKEMSADFGANDARHLVPDRVEQHHTDDPSVDRRAAIRTGLATLAGLVLTGCQRRSSRGWEPLSEGDAILAKPPAHRGLDPLDPVGSSAELGAPAGVIPRTSWTSQRTIAALANPMVRVRRITVHHDGMPPVSLRTRSDIRSRIELIRRSHVEHRQWADIGYHYIVDPLGNVWEGRPIRYQGAHVKNYNERNLGVLVLGNFDQQAPTRDATRALDAFLAGEMRRYNVPLSQVKTHQEYAPTACPGRSLQRHMEDVRGSRGVLARV
jgi:hypothetical protein